MMSPQTREKIIRADALLIDEISMLDGHLFDVVECMISIIRRYHVLSNKLKRIKVAAQSGDIIMSSLMLKLRWDSISELGLGDIPAFGGMQLIVVGDFYQLPPVPAGHDVLLMKNENLREGDYESKIGRQGSYAFESHAWNHSCFRTVELTEVHRHAENDGLFEFLNAMREGKSGLAIKYEQILNALQSPLPRRNDGIIPTELHALNRVVGDRNNEELRKLSTDLHEFMSLDEVELDETYKMKILNCHGLQHLAHLSFHRLIRSPSLPKYVLQQIQADREVFTNHASEQFFQKDCRVDNNIGLKTHAQVMLLWNLDLESKLANGSRGVVKGFFPSAGYYYLLRKEQMHRSSDGDGKEGAMCYKNDYEDAISDVKCDDFVDLTGDHNSDDEEASWDNSKKEANISDCNCDNFVDLTSDDTPVKATQVKSERKCMNHSSDVALLSADMECATNIMGRKEFDFYQVNPEFVAEVKSQLAIMETDILHRELLHMEKVESSIEELPFVQFASGTFRVIRPQPFSKVFKEIGSATRWQIPLTLAWAISIHKSQGMTIELLHVDLSNCFAVGQAYVACSRGKCIKSMTVKHFKPTEVKTSKKVTAFYEAVKNGKPYTGGIWSDTIAAFDEGAKKDMEKQKEMKLRYLGARNCKKCGSKCILGLAKAGNYRGKYYLSCPNQRYGDRGHTWELVSTTPLKKNDAQANNDGCQQFKLLTPGVDGAIEGRLKEKRFVVTGVFPELGGGFGLNLGRDRLKAMIESFDGKVTSSISRKTDYVIVGDEPGEKRLEEARSKRKPIINRSTLYKILTGESQLPFSAEGESQPTTDETYKV